MVELENPEQTVICYLVCEDIVGTLKSHELNPDVESTLYPVSLYPKLATPPVLRRNKTSGFIIARGLSEESAPAASLEATSVAVSTSTGQSTGSLIASETKDPIFLHIDDFYMSDFDDNPSQENKRNIDANASRGKEEIDLCGPEVGEPETNEQLPNGNYVCRHRCGDKKKCKHFCCRDGLEKPPKSLKRKRSIKDADIPQVLAQGKSSQQELVSSKVKQKPRMSAIVTHLKNADIEVLDLMSDGGSTYERRNTYSNLEKLKKLHSTSITTKTHGALINKPTFSYSSQEVAKPSFLGIERSHLMDLKEKVYKTRESKHLLGVFTGQCLEGEKSGGGGGNMGVIGPAITASKRCARSKIIGSSVNDLYSGYDRTSKDLDNGLGITGTIDYHSESSSSIIREGFCVEATEYDSADYDDLARERKEIFSVSQSEHANSRKRTGPKQFPAGEAPQAETSCYLDVLSFLGGCVVYSEMDTEKEPKTSSSSKETG